MARTKKVPFQAWESKAEGGIEKRYYRMGATIMASKALRGLSPSAFKIYCFMKIESGGRKEFRFPHSKYSDFLSKPTFFKVLRELEEQGFIDIIQRNGNLRKSNVYAFSDRWKSI